MASHAVTSIIARTRRRLGLIAAARAAGVGLAIGATAGAAIILIARSGLLPESLSLPGKAGVWPITLAASSLIVATVFAVRAYLRRPSTLLAAGSLDEALATSDAFRSAIRIDDATAGPFAKPISDRAESFATRARLQALFPIRIAGPWKFATLIVAAAAALGGFLPQQWAGAVRRLWSDRPALTQQQLAAVTTAEKTAEAAREVVQVAQDLATTSTPQDPAAADQAFEQAKAELDRIARDVQAQNLSPKQAREQTASVLDSTAQTLQKQAQQAQAAQDKLRDRFARQSGGMSSSPSGAASSMSSAASDQPLTDAPTPASSAQQAADDLTGAMQQGDWAKARDAAQRLQESMRGLTEQERQQIARQLAELENRAQPAPTNSPEGAQQPASQNQPEPATDAPRDQEQSPAQPQAEQAATDLAQRLRESREQIAQPPSESPTPPSREQAAKSESGKPRQTMSGLDRAPPPEGAPPKPENEPSQSDGKPPGGEDLPAATPPAGSENQGGGRASSDGSPSSPSAPPQAGEQSQSAPSSGSQPSSGTNQPQPGQQSPQSGQQPSSSQGSQPSSPQGSSDPSQSGGAPSSGNSTPTQQPDPSAPSQQSQTTPTDQSGREAGATGDAGTAQGKRDGTQSSAPAPSPGAPQMPAPGSPGSQQQPGRDEGSSGARESGTPQRSPSLQPGQGQKQSERSGDDAASPEQSGSPQAPGNQPKGPNADPSAPSGSGSQDGTPALPKRGLEGLREQLDQLAKERERGENKQELSEEMRRKAQELWDGASDEQRQELMDLARQMQQRGGQQPPDLSRRANDRPDPRGGLPEDPSQQQGPESTDRRIAGGNREAQDKVDGSKGTAVPPSGRGAMGDQPGNEGSQREQAGARNERGVRFENVDARSAGSDDQPDAGTVLAQWLSQQQNRQPGTGGTVTGGGSGPPVPSAAMDQARRAAERAIEQRQVPSRSAELVRKYFDRLPGALGLPATASPPVAPATTPAMTPPSTPPKTPTEPASKP